MPVIDRLAAFYRARGFEVLAGLNPNHFGGHPYAPYTWLIRDGQSHTNGLGIAPQEIFFLESLCAALRPERIFVIGNSFGWSTLALALANPAARVLAIDAGFDRNALDGIELTNEIARGAGLRATAVRAVSPQDVAAVLDAHLDGTTDLAFIDGLHTNEQVVIDFEAVRPYLAANGVMVFHDIHDAKMQDGFARIRALWTGESRILMSTPSGMGILFPPSLGREAKDVIEAFAPGEAALAFMRRQVWERRHRHLARWRRSLAKRLRRRS